ncbi:MAG: VPLPA-CTERM sorting domain-containing protein [Sulfuricaulis sp.]
MTTTKCKHPELRYFLRAILWPACAALTFAMPSAMAASVPLAPIASGTFTNGDGVNSHWVQVQNDWKGPSSFSQSYGGISSLQDAATALAMTSSSPGYMRSQDAVMSNVNAGNDSYNQLYGASWGYANMPPLFNTGDPNQENYAGHVSGYISIPTAGDYNFGVLYDDGFSFTLWGAGGSQSMSVDGLNSRDRLGFASNIAMQAGLYQFDLVGYNRLQSGVLSLGWWAPTSSAISVIPQSNLYTAIPPAPVPIPAAIWMFISGLAGLAAIGRAVRHTHVNS